MVALINILKVQHNNAFLNRFPSIAVIGVGLYISSFLIPIDLKLDIQLFLMSILCILIIFKTKNKFFGNILPNILPIFVFIIATYVSILFSQDIKRSILLSIPFLPAILNFFMVAAYFNSTKDIRSLYCIFSIISLGISVLLLKAVYLNPDVSPFEWISTIKSNVLIVKNDVTLLAIILPFSLAIIYRNPRDIFAKISAISVLFTIFIIGIFQSRIAMLTMIVSIIFFFLQLRPKIGFTFGICSIILVLFLDSLFGFPLLERFVQHWDGTGRIPLWLSAWKMFLDAPLFGQGPHTFVLFYNSYLNSLNLPEWLFVDHRIVPWPHNLYLEVLAEQGIVGFFAFSFLIAFGLFKVWNLRKAESTEIKILSNGAFASFIGFCFAGAFELTFLRQWVVLMMFTIVGVILQLLILNKKEGWTINEKILL